MESETPRLYHCTEFNSLCKILDSKAFYPSFCLEESNFMKEYKKGAYAVVCFADLLKNEVQRHLNSFNANSYIVMSKEWALNNLVSPVVYYNPKTIPAAFMKNWCKYILEEKLELDTGSSHDLPVKTTSLMFPFMKQYIGSYYDRKKKRFSDEKRCFYLEREWRWIPWVQDGEAYYLEVDEYLNDAFCKEKQDELINHKLYLNFTFDDIEEIGIPSQKHEEFITNRGELLNKIILTNI